MYLEEKVELLETEVQELKNAIIILTNAQHEEFMTPKEAADFLRCSTQTIHNRIKSGDIAADHRTGMPRIPKSQFFRDKEMAPLAEPEVVRKQPKKARPAVVSGIEDIRKQLYG